MPPSKLFWHLHTLQTVSYTHLAIRKKYPPIENYSVNLDKEYIEKIIQLPIYIPELSSKDIENYLMLLVVQEYCNIDQFKEFLKKIKEEKLLISNDVDVYKRQV